MEAPADDRFRHVVPAFRYPLRNPCNRRLGGRQTQVEQFDPAAIVCQRRIQRVYTRPLSVVSNAKLSPLRACS